MFRMRALFRTVDTNHRIERFLSSAAAVCIGLAVPFSQLGKANLTGLLVAACILVTLHPKRRLWLYGAKDCLLTPVGIAVAMVFLAWIPSVLSSLYPAKSAEVWLRTICYLGLGAVLWSFLRSNPQCIRISKKALLLGSAFAVLLIFVNFFVGTEYIRLLRLKPFTEGYAPKVMKHFAPPAISLFPIVLYFGYQLRGLWRWLSCFIAVAFLYFIYLTGSGAALLGLLVGAYFAGIAWFGRKDKRIVFAGLALIAGAVAILFVWVGTHDVLPSGITRVYPLRYHFIDIHRHEIWQFVFTKIPSELLFGYGIDASNKIAGANTVIPHLKAEYLPSHPHNWVLEILLDTGGFGCAALLFAMVLLLIRNGVASGEDPIGGLTSAALFGAYFGSGLVSFSFWASWWQVVFITLWALVSVAKSSAPTTSVAVATKYWFR